MFLIQYLMRFRFLLGLISAVTVCSAAPREWPVYALVSGGEAPYREASDLAMNTAIFQAGIGAGYRMRYLTPYVEAGLGKYNHGLFAEAYAGLQAGFDIAWLRPSLTVGRGVQSANDKRFNWGEMDAPAVGEEYTLTRKSYYPNGLGVRLDIFDKAYGEWEGRVEGYPMWKLEFGYRIW